MSGVYIKGFQFPEKSDMYYVKVECESGKNPMVTIWRKDTLSPMSYRAFECIPVPDHGRLIDADALKIRDLEKQAYEAYLREKHEFFTEESLLEYMRGQLEGLTHASGHVRFASTIIPADKEGEA